jgi:hypothetical protein
MAGRGLGAGKLRDACVDLASDFDLAPRSRARLACEGGERPDFAATQSKAFEIADGDSGLSLDVGILHGRTMRAFVGKQQCDRTHDAGGLAALLIAEGFEFMAFGFR